jgi:hypothetical protein
MQRQRGRDAEAGNQVMRAYCIESFGSVDGVVLDPALIVVERPMIADQR